MKDSQNTPDIGGVLSITHSNTNRNRIKKPNSSFMIVASIVVFLLLIALIFVPNCFTTNQATVCGIAGSTGISIYILLVTLNNEKRNNYFNARKNANVLSQILTSINNQISNIQYGSMFQISYPSNWLDYYRQCSIYLKYDYLEYLLEEFNMVDKINSCIALNKKEEAANLIERRRKRITDRTFDFDILCVMNNLDRFASDMEELGSWKNEKRYKEFKRFFKDNYQNRVIELTTEYLKSHGNSCESEDAEYYVMEELRNNEAALKSGTYHMEARENKKILNAIFEIYLKENDAFSICWGILNLKHMNDLKSET